MLAAVLEARTRGPITAYEAIVAPDGHVVGTEALCRVPGTTPLALLAAARATGELVALHEALLADAAAHRPAAGWLAVNVEPECLVALTDTLVALAASGPMALELTERSGPAPAELTAALTTLRAAGWRIHLDDVDDRPALDTELAVWRPELLKCSQATTSRCQFAVPGPPGPDAAAARLALTGFAALARRHGAAFVVEGVETAAELAAVRRTLPDALVQGWVFAAVPPGGTDSQPVHRRG